MSKFIVYVEKRLYATGTVVVEAANEEAAKTLVAERIRTGELQTTMAEWDEPSYADGSFTLLGEIDPAQDDAVVTGPVLMRPCQKAAAGDCVDKDSCIHAEEHHYNPHCQSTCSSCPACVPVNDEKE